jgi:hypothetical protein
MEEPWVEGRWDHGARSKPIGESYLRADDELRKVTGENEQASGWHLNLGGGGCAKKLAVSLCEACS